MNACLRDGTPRNQFEAVVFYTGGTPRRILNESMTSKRILTATGAARRRVWAALVASCLALGAPGVAAVAAGGTYQATVPLAGATEADRAAAFADALKVAAVRASGRPEAASAPRVVAAAADPRSYIQQYSTTAERMLRVGFDARSFEQLLQQAGLPLWPAERPATTVLMILPGTGRAITAGERPPERLELERAADARGVPLAWPGGVVDPAEARDRVAAGGTTLLALPGTSGGWDWTFAHAGEVAGAQGSATAGAGLAADRLAARYATPATRSLNEVSIVVSGVQGVRDYAALVQYLEGLSLVRSVEVRELSGDTLRLQLGVRGDLDLLRRIFTLDGRMRSAASETAGAPDFDWQS
jgi:uncharacterized protein